MPKEFLKLFSDSLQQSCLYCDLYSIGSMYAQETDLNYHSIGDQPRDINRCGNRRNTKQVTERHPWKSR